MDIFWQVSIQPITKGTNFKADERYKMQEWTWEEAGSMRGKN